MSNPLRNPARRLVSPAISLLDRRVTKLAERIDHLGVSLSAWAARTNETEELLGRSLSEIAAQLDHLTTEIETLAGRQEGASTDVAAVREELAWLAADTRRVLDGVAGRPADAPASLENLDELTSFYLNSAVGYRGLAAQAGVFVNEPVIVHYGPGEVSITDINERIVELPFVFRELSGLPIGARLVDVGSSESTVSLSLASLGYEVTTVDPRGYAFDHPNLTQLSSVIEAAPASFDAAVVLSTIEHVGVAHYGQDADPDADIELMSALAARMAPGGKLILTTPFGDGRDGGFQRIYEPGRLAKLLASWEVERTEIAQRFGTTEWRVGAADFDALPVVDDDEYRVVMLVATARA